VEDNDVKKLLARRLALPILALLLGACANMAPPVEAPPAETPPDIPAPYPPAVAARFPAPPVRYDTPAFAPGRHAYTTDEEMAAALRAAVAKAGADARLLSLGKSEAGAPIEAVLFARADGVRRPRVLLVGQQHGDEPAPAEALLVTARELAGGRLSPLLARIDVAVLPRANPDGSQAGSRVGSHGMDVNRDHLLLRTPEAQALARAMRELSPAVVVDAHEYTVAGRYLGKFDAVQRFDLLYQHAMVANLPPAIAQASERWFRQPLLQAMAAEQLAVEWYYTTSTAEADKRISMGGVQPDTGRNVNGLKNAVSVLLETRGVGIGRWHLARRVHTHVVAQRSLLESAAQNAEGLLAMQRDAGAAVAAQACTGEVTLLGTQTPTKRELMFLDPRTGADKPIVVDWNSALQLRSSRTRARPCGYWLAADAIEAVQRLRALGVGVERFEEEAALEAERWRETGRTETARPDVRGIAGDAGATIVNATVAIEPGRIAAAPGSFYVPLDQPLANLAVAALEPDTQNSYFANRLIERLDAAARATARPTAKRSPMH
jgi:hypothetical protein